MTKYFSNLNYSLANEDTTLEFEMMRRLKPKRILSVCGSGGRALPLLSFAPEELKCVDLAIQQLHILNLRVQTIKTLDWDLFLKFWGFAPFQSLHFERQRREIFDGLELEADAKTYFQQVFTQNNWQSILLLGKWESTFVFFSKIVQTVLGKDAKEIFKFDDIEDQRAYIKDKFPSLKWHFLLQVIGNKSVFNALLYKGDFVKKNISDSYFQFYKKAFDRIFDRTLARDNFFLSLCFLGKMEHQQANTIEAQEECFHKMKDVLKKGTTKITPLQTDLIKAVKESKDLEFVSMSDVPSYFTGTLEKNFLQDCKAGLALGAHVIIRSYLRVPEVDTSGYENVTKQFSDLIAIEKVQMYEVDVYKYSGT
jgi:S-adenosylmethionine-diacylglycerol 3-amino-3-carboxypropyl transferase